MHERWQSLRVREATCVTVFGTLMRRGWESNWELVPLAHHWICKKVRLYLISAQSDLWTYPYEYLDIHMSVSVLMGLCGNWARGTVGGSIIWGGGVNLHYPLSCKSQWEVLVNIQCEHLIKAAVLMRHTHTASTATSVQKGTHWISRRWASAYHLLGTHASQTHGMRMQKHDTHTERNMHPHINTQHTFY